jgi:apolipoprotein N-acyltransferase
MQKIIKYQPFLLSLLSGILIGTSFIPFPPWAATFGFVPLWFAVLKSKSTKSIFFLGWITQFVLTIIGFNWVAYTAHEFGRMPWIASILVLIAFSSFANLYIPLSLAAWHFVKLKLNPKPWILLLLLPTLTALAEYFIPTIFAWNFGYTWFAYQVPLFHIAEYIGFRGVSGIIIFINLLFLLPLIYKNLPAARRWSGLVGGVALFLLINFIGHRIGNSVTQGDQSLRVVIAQANIGNLEKVYAFKKGLYRDYIVDQFLSLSDKGIKDSDKKVDLLVWPETAFPDEIPEEGGNSSLYFRLANFLKLAQVPLVTGAYGAYPNTAQVSNSIYFIKTDGQFSDRPYHKTHLLAFGEYFPLGEQFPWLKEIVPAMGNFKRGHGPQVSILNGVKFGPQVCYESLFPEFSLGSKKLGSQILINVTNDSWFGRHQEPYQHMYMTLARAVENRIPLIRATNTGISTVVTAKGELLQQSKIHEPWVGSFDVPYSSEHKATFYNMYPNLTVWSWLTLFALLLVGSIVTRRLP